MTKLLKPVKRSTEARHMPHGFKNELVITLYPGGIVGVRENRKRGEVTFDLGDLYARSLVRAAMTRRLR